jgi:glucose-1-phosphate thymidylyltransferase
MKAILLAGGSGSRLHPLTQAVSKQLLPVYDKPVIYYPLSTLMLLGCRDVLVISTPRDLPLIESLLGNGGELGIRLAYRAQPRPEGIAQAFLIAEDWIAGEPVGLILGDNLFHGDHLAAAMAPPKGGARIFAYRVGEPGRYGVVTFAADGRALALDEKPANPTSAWAVPGLYFYDRDVVSIARGLKPSARGELEITDVNRAYLARGALDVRALGRGIAWLDCGTHDTLMAAGQFIQHLEQRQGMKVGCVEEVAWAMRYIDDAQLRMLAARHGDTAYGRYLLQLIETPFRP